MSLMKKFYSVVSKAKSKPEIRALEMRLLKPKPIKKYRGPKTGNLTEFQKRCIRITFPEKEWVKRWMKFFRVNAYVEYNTWDIDFLMELITRLEDGRLTWNKKNNRFYLHTKNGKIRI